MKIYFKAVITREENKYSILTKIRARTRGLRIADRETKLYDKNHKISRLTTGVRGNLSTDLKNSIESL